MNINKIKIENKIIEKLGIFLFLLIYLSLGLYNINSPFIHVSEDTNGHHGVAIINILKSNLGTTKLGLYFEKFIKNERFEDLRGHFYAHHPTFFILPTLLFYNFKVNETTTRLGPLTLTIISLIIFYLALRKLTDDLLSTFLTIIFLSILPGMVYYGKHLDPSPFVLAMSLICYSLFIFYYFKKDKKYLWMFFISIIVGIGMGWHFVFMPAAIWLVILIPSVYKTIPNSKKLLIFIPIFCLIGIIIQSVHIGILNGVDAVRSLFTESYIGRSGFFIKYEDWWKTIYQRAELNFTKLFVFTFFIGFLIYLFNLISNKKIRNRKSYFLFLPLILMPLFVTLLFQQWSTHPFGVIFYLPAVAFFSAYLFYQIYLQIKNKLVFSLIILIFLIIAAKSSYAKIKFFNEQFLILGNKDIQFLKEIKSFIKDNDVCLGKNNLGIYFGGIVMWYLEKDILVNSDQRNCLNQSKLALLFHPQLGEFYQKEAELFLNNGYKIEGCLDLLCVFTKE